jgi:ferrous iron transport protein A
MMTLDQLQKGDSAMIVDVLGEDSIAIRLMEMGLVEGETIQVVGFAPLGDPIEYAIHGYRISLRRREASQVVVEQSPREQ